MGTSLVTGMGNDRTGIVERLSDAELAAGANRKESGMARLGRSANRRATLGGRSAAKVSIRL